MIGGCKGSTGPASLNPKTGKPYGLSFPVITIADMVEARRHLIDVLGIDRLLCVAGGSMGGMRDIRFLVLSFSSDWLYPPTQSKDIVRQLKKSHADVAYCDLKSNYGHDAFILETEGQTQLIRNILSSNDDSY